MELKLIIIWGGLISALLGINFFDVIKNQLKGKWKVIVPLILSIVGIILTIIVIKNENRLREEKFNNAVFLSLQELKSNKEYLSDLRESLKSNDTLIRIGKLKCERTKSLSDTLYSEIIKNSYGEEKNFYSLISKMNNSTDEFKLIKNYDDLRNWNRTYELTVDDLYFLNSFLYWYIGNTFKDKEEINKYFPPTEFESDKAFYKDDNVNMRYFVFEKEPIREFSLYLGLID